MQARAFPSAAEALAPPSENQASNCWVTFNSNGGQAVAGQQIAPGGKITQPASPARPGYVFAGWYSDSSLATAWNFDQSVSSDNITLYAKWQYVTYTVILDPQGGSDGTPSVSANYGAAMPPATAPAKTGYIFGGYYDAVSGGARYYDSAMAGVRVWDKMEDATLYARWTAVTYTVAYNANGGSGITAPGSHTYDEPAPLTANGFSRAGYTFAGWALAPGGPAAYSDGETVENLSDTQGATVTLYAVWEIIVYAITYNRNGGSGDNNPAEYTVETPTVTLAAPLRTGYGFAGWYAAADFSGSVVTAIPHGSTGNLSLYAKWEPTVYTVSYVFNGGSDPGNAAAYTIESPVIPLASSARRGYDFAGWYTNASFSGSPVASIPAGSTGNKTFYAKWQVITYTISWTLNGGSVSPANPVTYTVESPDIVFNDPAREGYVFRGWYTNSDFTGVPVTEIPADSVGDRAYYARWEAVIYRIAYTLNGGINHNSNPLNYTVESSAVVFRDPSRRGYRFLGWFDNAEFAGDPVTIIPHGSTGDVSVYAKWEVIIYPVEYALNGGENAPENPGSYTVENPDIAFLDADRAGYSFAGWYDNAGFIDAPVAGIPAGSTGAVKVFARWARGISFPTGREHINRYSGDPKIF
jgi:uncharacterized repeat protein (TIGR02543 family)